MSLCWAAEMAARWDAKPQPSIARFRGHHPIGRTQPDTHYPQAFVPTLEATVIARSYGVRTFHSLLHAGSSRRFPENAARAGRPEDRVPASLQRTHREGRTIVGVDRSLTDEAQPHPRRSQLTNHPRHDSKGFIVLRSAISPARCPSGRTVPDPAA